MLSINYTRNREITFLPASGSLIYMYKPAVHQ